MDRAVPGRGRSYFGAGKRGAPLKIAQLSDLHTHGVGARERQVLDILDDEMPDVIVVTGDSLGGYGGTYAMVEDVFQQLHAPLGVWVVHGNFENWKPMQHEHSFYANAVVHWLLNSGTLLRNDVWLAGVDDPYTGKPSIEGALTGAPPGVYEILLFHSPAYFDRVAGHVDLCLQVISTAGRCGRRFCRHYGCRKDAGPTSAGWYEAKGTKSKMYVNRGNRHIADADPIQQPAGSHTFSRSSLRRKHRLIERRFGYERQAARLSVESANFSLFQKNRRRGNRVGNPGLRRAESAEHPPCRQILAPDFREYRKRSRRCRFPRDCGSSEVSGR